jgi:hypothetical protein
MDKDAKSTESVEKVTEPSTETEVTETEEVTKTSEGKGKDNAVPYNRFKEVVDQKNDLNQRFEALETQFADKQTELGQLIEVLQNRENDAAIVTAIREIARTGTDEQKGLVDQLDKILKGEELPPEEDDVEGKSDPKSADDKKFIKLIEKTREELTEHAADQQTDLLLMKADILAEKYFEALPPQYTEQDKQIISKLLIDDVAWDSIEGNPDSLNDEVAKSFERTLELFGDPRGSVAEEEVKEESTTEVKAPEPEIPEHLTKDWGNLKSVTLPDGKTTLQPEFTDEDFRAGLAEELRRTRSGG